MVQMRPSTLLAAASLLGYAAASADVTVVKTVTNTHTVCPLSLQPTTCEASPTDVLDAPEGHNTNLPDDAEMSEAYSSMFGGLETVSVIEEVTKTWLDWSLSASTTGLGGSSTTQGGSTSGHEGSSASHGSSTTEHEGSSTSHGSSTTSMPSNSTTTSSSSSTGSATPTGDWPVVKQGEGKEKTLCNTADNRSKWCDGKTVDSDYYKEYKSGQTCKFDLTITNTTLSFDKGPIMSFAINGQSPGPVIECNWGDMIEITVNNKLQDNATTIHWHGIRQIGTNDMDGVPGISECALVPGQSKTYRFLASSYGTGW